MMGNMIVERGEILWIGEREEEEEEEEGGKHTKQTQGKRVKRAVLDREQC